jgi:hypothetical protein
MCGPPPEWRLKRARTSSPSRIMRAHQLPGGLLPAGITAFRHDAATGAFEADDAAAGDGDAAAGDGEAGGRRW